MLLLSSKFKLIRCFFWLLLIHITASQANAGPSEYELKAAFLHNLSNFITWPPKAFLSDDAPFILCVLGTDPFGDNLEAITTNQRVAGQHAIQISKITNEIEAKDCHLVFISSSEQNKIAKIVNFLKNFHILTVGDTEDFIDQGGMIMFMTVEGKIKLAISPERIIASQLKASAQLLKIAKIINK
jgi:hypothetical protein